jgi:arylsulfatase A-like enzyme
MRAYIKSWPHVVVILCIQLIACGAGLYANGERPNILWITSEDNNIDWVGCYGNPHADTPNIDQLASEGFQYMHCYANAPVCAPSRSTWITGMLAISNGTFPMRSRHEIPHDQIPYYPDQLRAAGYYTANWKKTDFNIGGREDSDCWDHHGEVEWETLQAQQPFFQIINLTASHESKAHGEVDDTDHDPADVRLRAYHPDLPDIRKNYAKYHDAVKRMDTELGAVLARLEELGLADNTIVIHNSDHGGVLPRSKRYIFSSGLHCPLIVRIPEKYQALWPAEQSGAQIDRLVSFVDMPKTWLSLVGAEVPSTMQGTIFLGPQTEPEPEYHFAFRGRMDERLDNARALTDKRYLYIRNYMPYVPWMQHLAYLWRAKATQAWDAHVQSGKASEVEARFFAPKGWTEELYDLQKDPDNVVNLVNRSEYAQILVRMRGALRTTQLRHHDAGLLPESEMIRRAAENDLTIYEMVRDPKLYDLPALLDAADLALERNPDNLPQLEQLFESPDCGLRYWGVTGCFLLDSKPAQIDALLKDPSHEVRLMAAWLLIRTGEKERGFQALEGVLRENDYAMLTAMNMIDWIGEEARPLLDSLPEEAALGNYEQRMLGVLQARFNETTEK